MVMVKRCEKEVEGSWAEKQQQAKEWLSYFVPHYCNRCRPGDGCPAKHTAVTQQPTRRLRSGEVGKRFLDGSHPDDKVQDRGALFFGGEDAGRRSPVRAWIPHLLRGEGQQREDSVHAQEGGAVQELEG